MITHDAREIHPANAKRVFVWFWHSWLEAQAEVPLLRWLGLAALMLAALGIARALVEGRTLLEVLGYGSAALLFMLLIPVIFYLLFEIYRKHRTDAIFDSKRLADLIHKIAKEEARMHRESQATLKSAREYLNGQDL